MCPVEAVKKYIFKREILARQFGLTSSRLFSWTRAMNDEEKSFKDLVKILKTNDGYVTMPNWVPLVAIILLIYKVFELAVENSLALKQLGGLTKNSSDKLELIDRNNDMNKVHQDVSNAKNIEEILKWSVQQSVLTNRNRTVR